MTARDAIRQAASERGWTKTPGGVGMRQDEYTLDGPHGHKHAVWVLYTRTGSVSSAMVNRVMLTGQRKSERIQTALRHPQ